MNKIREWAQRHYLAAYTMIFFAVAGVVFSFIPIFRTSLIHASDGFNQCYPTYVYIGRYIREFIPNLLRYHTVPMFDFSIGYGDDILATLNWFGFGNIFYLLAALAPAKWASVVFTLQTILQLYVAGLVFLWVSADHSEDVWSRIAGALIYAFCAYALSFGVNFPSFLMAYVTFPVVMNGSTRILRSERFILSRRYVAAIFLQSCCGFYFLYIDMIAVAVYVLLYGIHNYRNRIVTYLKRIVSLGVQTCVAAGMAGVILLPVVLAYLGSARSGEQSGNNEILSLYSAEEIMGRLRGVLDIDATGTAIGLTIPVVVLIAVFLMKYRNRYPVLAAGVILCIVGYFVPAAGSIMNGFSYSIDRWVYILHYLVAVIAVIVLPNLAHMLRQEVRLRRSVNAIAAMVFVAWAAATLAGSIENMRDSAIHIAWIGVTLLILVVLEQHGNGQLMIYSAACTVLAAFLYFAPTQCGGDGNYISFKNFYTWHELEASAFANASAEEEFYRTDIYDSSLNGALVTGTNSASSYYSIGNSGPFNFLNERLVSTGTEGSSFTLRGLDGRKSLEMFLSVHSYTLDRTAEEIAINDLKLPLGFTYTAYMTEEDAAELDPLDRNQNVLKAVELETSPSDANLTRIMSMDSEWEALPCRYEYENIDVRDDVLTAGSNAELRIALPDDVTSSKTSEYYLVLHGFEWLESGFERHLEVGGKRMRIVPMGSYPGQSREYMIKVDLTDSEMENGCLAVRLDEGQYSLTGVELRRLDISHYDAYYDQLTKAVLENVTASLNRISGTIHTEQDRVLLMTIPYSTGWTCMVDGVEQKVYKADQGFSAVVIPAGDHEVVWAYCTPGILTGACISVASILILCLLLRRQRKAAAQIEL